MNHFYWCIKLRASFRDNTKVKKQTEEEVFKKPTNKTCVPDKNHHTVETFIKATKSGVEDELKTVRSCRYTNLSRKEQKALKELKHREDTFVTNADKGGAVVILDVKDCTKESESQFNNTKHYRHLEHDLITESNATVNKVIARFKDDKLVSRDISDGLKVESSKAPRLYTQPKIHKDENLGKPVISSLNCHISKISEYVDFHLQPVFKQIPS